MLLMGMRNGLSRAMVVVTNTGVDVLAIATLIRYPGCDMWIAFGHNKDFWVIATHIAEAFGPRQINWGCYFSMQSLDVTMYQFALAELVRTLHGIHGWHCHNSGLYSVTFLVLYMMLQNKKW